MEPICKSGIKCESRVCKCGQSFCFSTDCYNADMCPACTDKIIFQVYILEEANKEFPGRVLCIGSMRECSNYIDGKIREMSSTAFALGIDLKGQKETSGIYTTGYNVYWGSLERTHRICMDEYKPA